MTASEYSILTTELSGLPGRILRDERFGLEVTILDRGAEPVSLRRYDATNGRWVAHFARDGEVSAASVWQPLHCTHLGFHAHTLVDRRSPYGGEWVRGEGHGLLPDHPHRRVAASAGPAGAVAAYRIEPEDYSRDLYPRALVFTIEQALRDGWLEVTYRAENREGARPVHLSFGAHPAFPIAEPESFEIRLAPGTYRHWLIDEQVHLTGETWEIVVDGGFRFPWTIASLASPVMLEMVDVDRPWCVGYDPVAGLGVELDLADRPYLTFWSNAPSFVCIEPIWGLPDAAEQKPFDQKDGILTIPAGGTLARRFRLRPFGAG